MSWQWLLLSLLKLADMTEASCSGNISCSGHMQTEKLSDVAHTERRSETSFRKSLQEVTQILSESFREPKMFSFSPEDRTQRFDFPKGIRGPRPTPSIPSVPGISYFNHEWNPGRNGPLNKHYPMSIKNKAAIRASSLRRHQRPRQDQRNGLRFGTHIHSSLARRPLAAGKPAGDIPVEVLQLLPDTVRKVYNRYSTTTARPATTTTKPPVIWFPSLNAECEEEATASPSSGGGFNAFSFLAMAVSLTNLVSLLASNANNNINNNNNNNNLNNDNVLDGNEDNNNNNLDLLTMVTFAGRKRRDLPLTNDTFLESEEGFIPTPEDVAAGVALLFLKVWYQATRQVQDAQSTASGDVFEHGQIFDGITSDLGMTRGLNTGNVFEDANKTKSLNSIPVNVFDVHITRSLETTPRIVNGDDLKDDSLGSNPEHVCSDFNAARTFIRGGKSLYISHKRCVLKALCQANRMSIEFGKLGEDIAEVMSAAFVEFLPGWVSARGPLSVAGSRGRSGVDCPSTYSCELPEWNSVTTDEYERELTHSLLFVH